MKKIIISVCLLLFVSGCTNQEKPKETVLPVSLPIENEVEVVENDEEVIGTYILYYDGDKGSSGVIIVLGPSSELTMLIPQLGNVLQSYRGSYSAIDGVLSFDMLEIPPYPNGQFGHSIFEYVVDGENVLLTHTDYSNARNEKTLYILEDVDTLKLVKVIEE